LSTPHIFDTFSVNPATAWQVYEWMQHTFITEAHLGENYSDLKVFCYLFPLPLPRGRRDEYNVSDVPKVYLWEGKGICQDVWAVKTRSPVSHQMKCCLADEAVWLDKSHQNSGSSAFAWTYFGWHV
jgi:hypothetical protein